MRTKACDPPCPLASTSRGICAILTSSREDASASAHLSTRLPLGSPHLLMKSRCGARDHRSPARFARLHARPRPLGRQGAGTGWRFRRRSSCSSSPPPRPQTHESHEWRIPHAGGEWHAKPPKPARRWARHRWLLLPVCRFGALVTPLLAPKAQLANRADRAHARRCDPRHALGHPSRRAAGWRLGRRPRAARAEALGTKALHAAAAARAGAAHPCVWRAAPRERARRPRSRVAPRGVLALSNGSNRPEASLGKLTHRRLPRAHRLDPLEAHCDRLAHLERREVARRQVE